jgi:hypothetical protein
VALAGAGSGECQGCKAGKGGRMPSLRIAAALAGAVLIAGCATQDTSINKSLSRQSDRPLPRRILLAQPDIRVHEVSTGGVIEKVDEWSNKASDEAAKSLEALAQSTNMFELVPPSKLSDAQRATLEQYSALYILVAGSASLAQRSPYAAWKDRAADFDYTLGPGLSGVAGEQKLDAVVFVVGTDHISSAGRKAAMVVGVLAAAFTGVMIIPSSIPSFLTAGVVDMRTGDVLWFSTETRAGADDLRDPAVLKSVIDGLFKTYPGAVKTADAKK